MRISSIAVASSRTSLLPAPKYKGIQNGPIIFKNFSSGGGASHGSRKEKKKLGGLDAEGQDLYAFMGCLFSVGQFIPRLNEQRVPRHTDAAMPYKNEKAENGQAPNKRERRE